MMWYNDTKWHQVYQYTYRDWFYLDNKGIAFKARLVCAAWYKHGRDHYLSGKNNGHARVLSGRTNQARIKNNTVILILKHFQK